MKAGALYFAIVFVAGFAAGTVRTLWLAPRTGALAAVAIELPIMLSVAWVACGLVLRRYSRDSRRSMMALTAFALLMAAELCLALAFGATPQSFLESLITAPGLLGLAGQIAFAAIPLVRRP